MDTERVIVPVARCGRPPCRCERRPTPRPSRRCQPRPRHQSRRHRAGLTSRQWCQRIASGQWTEMAPGVFGHSATLPTWKMHVRAGLTWLGPDAAMCGETSGRWMALDGCTSDSVEFLIPRGRRGTLPRFELPPRRCGIPPTSPATRACGARPPVAPSSTCPAAQASPHDDWRTRSTAASDCGGPPCPTSSGGWPLPVSPTATAGRVCASCCSTPVGNRSSSAASSV